MSAATHKLFYTLMLADNALILGHRLSEWCGHGPVLEQDIALTNASLDHLGGARSLYQYAAEQFNSLGAEEKDNVFTSPALDAARARNTDGRVEEDDLAFLRDSWDFRNLLLTEQPNKDWAYTIARGVLYDCFQVFYLKKVIQCPDETLASIAAKSLKEAEYHLRWSSEWLIRLGDGTDESHARMQQALNDYWAYTTEMFAPVDYEAAMTDAGIAPDLKHIESAWNQHMGELLEEAGLKRPEGNWLQNGGKEGRHSEHLGYILAEMQYLQRAYPGMEW